MNPIFDNNVHCAPWKIFTPQFLQKPKDQNNLNGIFICGNSHKKFKFIEFHVAWRQWHASDIV